MTADLSTACDASPKPADSERPTTHDTSFPIVGVGASAGGLEAFTQLLKHLPPDSGMAFVLIQHLDPTHSSMLGEMLAGATRMPVTDVVDGVAAEPNHVYVMPPNTCITLQAGRLELKPRSEERHLNLPIDHFLRSLAEERGSQAIGVVLSGTASDGTEGLAAIKAENGITFVQSPNTAKFPGMPQSATDAGVVDYSLPLAELAVELVRLSHHPYVTPGDAKATPLDLAALREILALVRAETGLDFAEWKRPTVDRRLQRRMALRKVETLAAYLAVLRANADEIRALAEDTLIHVTSFFRDAEAFVAMKEQVFPAILRAKADGAAVRIWVAGCSTGEEVYSIAITMLEYLAESRRSHPVQIFGSDVSEHVIDKARAGFYSEAAVADVSPTRCATYFSKTEEGYRINKMVRDLCVFTRHDLGRDPPFSKLDLVTCRNVLIYFDQALQKRVVPLLHYCLNEPGFLLLGRTETLSGFGALFSVADKTHRVYSRKPGTSRLHLTPASPSGALTARAVTIGRLATDSGDISKQLDRALLERYAPPGLLINERMDVLEFRGQTGDFLQPAAGAPQNNLVKMARPGLVAALQTALTEAKSTKSLARKLAVTIPRDGGARTCDLVVMPLARPPAGQEPLYVVLFERPSAEANAGTDEARQSQSHDRPSGDREARIAQLEHELSATREDLELLIEDQGRTNDDLGSTNEELVSGNEELQSINEELETAKEELQSTNEELTTVNDELHSRNHEMKRVNSDLVNVLSAVDLPILILDSERKIRRFTPRARHILNVVASDVGRPLEDLKLNIRVPDLDAQVAAVINTMVMREVEVRDESGHWFSLQIRPYTTAEGQNDGAIVSLVDIDALKHLVRDAEGARAEAELANLAKDQFLATLSHELRTPLTTMLMHAQILGRGQSDPERVKLAGQAIERATMMQVQLIEDLVDVSRIVAGKLGMQHVPVDLRAVVETAQEWISAAAQRKSLKLVVEIEPLASTVLGDAGRLQQIVANLLTNAVKFTPPKGTVTLRLSSSGGTARLQVQDTGIGIDAAFLSNIFDRFTQADASNTRSNSGLGLGLSIVKHLVELHGGTIRAESAGAGQGSTFTVELPLNAASAAVDETPGVATREGLARMRSQTTVGTSPLRGLRILLVDDDAGSRDAVGAILELAHAVVQVAASAEEGIAALAEFHPDALISDISMPGEDGYSFIRRVRTLPACDGGDVRALALTALAGDADVSEALDAGFQLHVAKPVGIDRLTAAVVELMATVAPRAR